ncbi:hypothetical protein JNW90_26525 [Micromonospora sp. STR1s_5]|nr:hypothetical protein [Micromonospora sp. STR1s_5]
MMEADARTYVVRVSRHDDRQPHRRVTRFFAVMADSETEALEAVRSVAEPGDFIEQTDGRLLPETARALGLLPGVAKPM